MEYNMIPDSKLPWAFFTVYADNHLGRHSKGQYYWMRNKEQYLLILSKGHRFWAGLQMSTALSKFILVESY
jgi:hypothetical protein